MASLVKIKSLIAPLTTKNYGVAYNVIRTKVYTNFDYMPGPRPKTEEEMKKAAEKYGLHRAEYELYPDDGMHPFGDYPKLPMIGTALKDPYYPYDYPHEKRNFGEVMHRDLNIMGEDRCDFGEKLRFGYREAPMVLGTVLLLFLVCYLLADPYPMSSPAFKQQVPKPGTVHYTFEPAK